MPNKLPKDAEMSDAVYARGIIDEIWPIETHGRKSVIASAYDAIERFERSLPIAVRRGRKRQWTERRIRSIVDDEAPALEHYEITDLERMAVREGRDAYRKSIERSARIAAFLAHADEAFHGEQIAAQVAYLGALAGAGTGMAAVGSHAAGEGADRPGEWAGRVSRSRASGGDE